MFPTLVVTVFLEVFVLVDSSSVVVVWEAEILVVEAEEAVAGGGEAGLSFDD